MTHAHAGPRPLGQSLSSLHTLPVLRVPCTHRCVPCTAWMPSPSLWPAHYPPLRCFGRSCPHLEGAAVDGVHLLKLCSVRAALGQIASLVGHKLEEAHLAAIVCSTSEPCSNRFQQPCSLANRLIAAGRLDAPRIRGLVRLYHVVFAMRGLMRCRRAGKEISRPFASHSHTC